MRVKKTNENAILPKRQTDGAAGYDLYVPDDIMVPRGRSVIKIGIAIELPEGCQAEIRPRSGFSLKGFEGYTDKEFKGEPQRFDCDSTIGTIDEDYRDSVGVIVNNRDVPFFVKRGTRIAQMVITRYETFELEETDDLSVTGRNGGFGSTGTAL